MNNKKAIIVGSAVVILVVAIVILVFLMNKNNPSGIQSNNIVKSGQSGAASTAGAPDTVTVIETNVSGEQVETQLDIVSPGKAIDSSAISPESLSEIPLNEEAFIKYGSSGLETKTITARSGARVFLTFSATDEESHIFSFTDPSMSSILVMFSKAEGDKSINFLAPGPGSYEYSVDGEEKGMLTVR